jgi:hypothetical protein
LIGSNENSLVINDPATFPFIKCTASQLIDARCYRVSNPNEPEFDQQVTEKDLGFFDIITVMPKDIRLPLLSQLATFVDEAKVGDADSVRMIVRRGLIDEVIDYLGNTNAAGLVFELSSLHRPNVSYHLVRAVGADNNIQLHYFSEWCSSAPDLKAVLIDSKLRSYFWVVRVKQLDVEQKSAESYWVWNASRSDGHNQPLAVYFRKADEAWSYSLL